LRDSRISTTATSSSATACASRSSTGAAAAGSADAAPEPCSLRHARPAEHETWNVELRLEEFLARFGLDPERPPDTSSGGERKRGALALALALAPDLLLLDEPTNHLDIQGIELLEQLLVKVPASIVITHDRAFLDRVTTRIVELDRGVLRSYPGNYAAYETRRQDELSAEAITNPALRQVLGAGGGLDPPGCRSAAHPQRRTRRASGTPAQGARGAARAARQHQIERRRR
jgi:ATPase subunit of ABC transporter with duplicated ATPase domains